MPMSLLETFLAEECTLHVQRVLEKAIADTAMLRTHVEFNRFEVTIERSSQVVVIADVLDASETGGAGRADATVRPRPPPRVGSLAAAHASLAGRGDELERLRAAS